MAVRLRSLAAGRWIEGSGPGEALIDPVSGDPVAHATSNGIDFGNLLQSSRVAGASLRAMNYAARAELIGKTAEVLSQHRARYLNIALQNSGSTETDASMDIDGAIFTLKYFARAGAALGSSQYLTDGAKVGLSKDGSFDAVHLARPLTGVAIHVNAFNFPAWGLWEKAAPALLAGVPVLSKPATATAWLAYEMIKDVVESKLWPVGCLSLICGRAGDLLDHVESRDVLSFTGSAATAATLRGHPRVIARSVRVNVEADSVNCALLGPDIGGGAPEFDLFIKEVAREMTVKAGQKCTAIRRILVPSSQLGAAAEALCARLSKTTVGDPRNKAVRMGPVVNKDQQQSAFLGIAELSQECRRIYGGTRDVALTDGDYDRGAFVPPTLLCANDSDHADRVHELEIFGPVATLLAYRDLDHAISLAERGQGSLVASVFSADPHILEAAAANLASTHGRVMLLDASVGASHTGHGNVVPQCLHGGPGRAGGGEELGGLRSLAFYHRRVAVQGPAALTAKVAEHGGTSAP